VWQLYPQHDAAHHPKMEAFLARWMAAAGVDPLGTLGCELHALWRTWNAMDAEPVGASNVSNVAPGSATPADGVRPNPWPDLDAWAVAARRATEAWSELPELAAGLIAFAALPHVRTAGPTAPA
jgi:hypothetical protein